MRVDLSQRAEKQLTRLPAYIVKKFALWVDLVSVEGLAAARAIPGYRDHGLKGDWQGYRAVRLNERTGPSIRNGRTARFTSRTLEVNKHDY